MSDKVRDFYFSSKSFRCFELGIGNRNEKVGECLVDGVWVPFTEVIDKGLQPHSKPWGDLEYIGESSQVRYTNALEWAKNRPK